jgi:hypothetical protein
MEAARQGVGVDVFALVVDVRIAVFIVASPWGC